MGSCVGVWVQRSTSGVICRDVGTEVYQWGHVVHVSLPLQQPSGQQTCVRGPLYTLTDYHVSDLVVIATTQ